MPTRPIIISLTTDFGLIDPFVGVMKGVIAAISPAAQVIDITHSVAAFDALDGALAIWQAWRYFPAETIHVIVVDPGVGSERQAILSRMGNHWFVAPDNGVLTLVELEVLRTGRHTWYRRIINPRYMLPVQSNTFHGRDIFAPAAAHLATQIAIGKVAAETFGPVVEGILQLPVPVPIHKPDGSIEGVVLKSDKFGNLLTNIAASDLPASSSDWMIETSSWRVTRFVNFYAEAEPGEIFAILGSSGLLEIAMNRGSAQVEMGIAPGVTFRIVLKEQSF